VCLHFFWWQEYFERRVRDQKEVVRPPDLFGTEKTQVFEVGQVNAGGAADPWLQGFVKYLKPEKASPCRVETRDGVHEILKGVGGVGERVECGKQRSGFGGTDGQRPVPVAFHAIIIIMSVRAGAAEDIEGTAFHGHSGEGFVQKGDESSPDPAFYEIDRRCAGLGVYNIGPDIDLVERDGWGRDMKGVLRVTFEDYNGEEGVVAVDRRGHENAGYMACDPPRGQQVRDVKHVFEGHDHGRCAFPEHYNETIIWGPAEGNRDARRALFSIKGSKTGNSTLLPNRCR